MPRIGWSAVRAFAVTLLFASTAHAQQRLVKVTINNVAPTNSVSFAPLHLGFHSGVFDAFNNGQTAAAGIVSVAEGGVGDVWQADFAAAEPNATRGVIGMPLFPGQSRSQTFVVNAGLNPFFTFATMVIPSNDLFLGNDNPMRYRMFDVMGNLLINNISQSVGQIWDAGSEVADPLNAAFVVGGNNSARTPQNGVVSFSASELGVFNGLTTAAGYVFSDSQLNPSTAIYRLDFESTVVPEPSTLLLLSGGFTVLLMASRRKRTRS